MNFNQFVDYAANTIQRYSPQLLTICGIASMGTAIIVAVKATPKVMKVVENAEKEKQEPLTKVELVKTAAPFYAPSALAAGVGVACIVGASRINMHRNAVLAAAYTLSESALQSYTAKTAEIVGADKAREISQAVALDRAKATPKPDENDIINNRISTYSHRVLCYESLTGRYFYSSRDLIDRAVNDLNRIMRDECFISMNEWFDTIGLTHTSLGDELGWSMERGYVDISYSSKLDDQSNPTLVIGYIEMPVPLHNY